MSLLSVIALLILPVLFAVGMGSVLLKRACMRPKLLPEELALAVAWVFMVGSLVWLGAYLGDYKLLGFGAPWSWLAASHFAFAGYGALTVTALTCRSVSHPKAIRVLRYLLVAHPIAYLITAAGISGYPYCDELGASSYELIFIIQLIAFICGQPDRMGKGARRLLTVSLVVPVVTLVFALAWAWGRPIFDLSGMVRYHGLMNAFGHVGLGLIAFAWGRPRSHSAGLNATNQPV